MLQLPFFRELAEAENILIAGAGGGYDVYAGLPLYFGLKAQGKNVHLSNLSFAFSVSALAERLQYSELLLRTETYEDVWAMIEVKVVRRGEIPS